MEKAYGIDLGTTYSVISTLDQMGSPVIIEDNDAASELLASAVYFQEDGQVTVGDNAKEDGVMHPERLMQFFKRWIGRNEDPTRTIYEVDGKEYDPIELSSIVLGRMVQYANAGGEDVKHVIITCPAYFNYAQRDATKQAGIAAGLDVLAVINEPTAAAISYCYNRYNEDQIVLVYDLGGGTFDVTLMEMSEKDGVRNVDVIGTDGDAMLGGCDWDEALFAILQNKYAEQFGDLPGEELKYEIRGKVEEVKKKLSLPNKESFTLKLEYEGESVKLEVTRAEFEEATVDLVQKTVGFLDKMLEKAGLTDDDLDVVLMVGGSTRMPMIKNMLISRFGERAILNDPDKAVAKGAALIADNIFAGKVMEYLNQLQDMIKKGEVRLTNTENGTVIETPDGTGGLLPLPPVDIDNIPVDDKGNINTGDIINIERPSGPVINVGDIAARTFGIIARQENDRGQMELIVDHIVHQGEKTPCEYTRTYYTPRDNASVLLFPVVQSVSQEKYDVIDKDEITGDYIFPDSTLEMEICNTLTLEVPMPLPKDAPLDVYFTLDNLGNVSLSVTEPSSGHRENIEFNFNTISQDKLDEIKESQANRIYADEQ